MSQNQNRIHEVFPYLRVKGAPAAIDFYKKVFDATERFRLTEHKAPIIPDPAIKAAYEPRLFSGWGFSGRLHRQAESRPQESAR